MFYRNVYRDGSFHNNLDHKKELEPPFFQNFEKKEEIIEEVYEGPTAEDLRQEAENFKQHWAIEKAGMIQKAQLEAQEIIAQAQDEAEKMVEDAKIKIKNEKVLHEEHLIFLEKEKNDYLLNLEQELRVKMDLLEKETLANAEAQAYSKGYLEGQEEVKRFVERLHTILDSVISKKQEIIDHTQDQIIALVLQMTRKILKQLTETQEDLVIQNILHNLKQFKVQGKVTIRVNLEDLSKVQGHVTEFIEAIESLESVQVIEDDRIDKAGCIIDTDYGEIDARIALQLEHLETKVLAATSVNVREKIQQD